MRLGLTCVVLSAVVFAISPASAGRKPASVSWGKPGVSFADYRRDTLECANKTYGLDVSMKPETVHSLVALNNAAFFDFLQTVDTAFSRGGLEYRGGEAGYLATLSQAEPGHVAYQNTTYQSQFRNAARVDVVDQLQAVLDYCLASRGYQRFRLNADQREQLHRFRYGTGARAHFLYRLGSDPQVLASEAVPS